MPGSGGPSPAVRGASVLEGERFGRAMRIELDGSRVTIHVRARSSTFEIESRQGKLEAVKGGESIRGAIAPLRKAKRWAGLRVRGGASGITATRDSRGVNMWLYDLWLIERILKETAANQ